MKRAHFLGRIVTLVDARNKEFFRDRGNVIWNLLFPFFVVLGFNFAYSGGNQALFKVGAIGTPRAAEAFFKMPQVQIVAEGDVATALEKLRRHQVDMVVDAGPARTFWINETAPKGDVVARLLLGEASRAGSLPYRHETVSGKEIRYVDWLMPGVMGMNVMFSALFGVGYVIVRYRKNGTLRRYKATPISAFEFLAAQVLSRFLIVLGMAILIYLGCDLLVDFRMLGSPAAFFTVIGMGSICLISLGLIVASRVRSEEFAGGLLNLFTWPMMFFSGVWFSLEGMNPLLRKIALAFPLTHMIDAARAVMTEGATLAQVAPQLALLGGLSIVFLGLGAWLFKWE